MVATGINTSHVSIWLLLPLVHPNKTSLCHVIVASAHIPTHIILTPTYIIHHQHMSTLTGCRQWFQSPVTNQLQHCDHWHVGNNLNLTPQVSATLLHYLASGISGSQQQYQNVDLYRLNRCHLPTQLSTRREECISSLDIGITQRNLWITFFFS